MNPKIIFTLLALFVLKVSCTIAQPNASGPLKENSLDELNLKGPVRQINESQFKASLVEGKVVRGSKINMYPAITLKKFNEQGYIVERTFYQGDSIVFVSIRWSQSEERTVYPKDSDVYKSTKFIYDGQGHLIEETEYSPEGNITSRDRHRFDEKGYRSETTLESFGTRFDSKLVFKRDENGNEVECLTYMGGKLYSRNINTFNGAGNKTGEKHYLNEGLTLELTNKYDDRGNLIERKGYQSTGAYTCYKYKFDERGNETEWGCYEEDGRAKYRYVHSFNEHNDWVEEIEYDPGGTAKRQRTFEYVYDSFGNWTQKTIFENGVPYKITERRIEYFE